MFLYNAIIIFFLRERPLHCPRVTVWCAVAEFGIWNPHFFEENNVTVTVNSDRYCEMLETFFRSKLNMLCDIENVCFQQDGATAHASRLAMGILREMFPGHLISLRGDIGFDIQVTCRYLSEHFCNATHLLCTSLQLWILLVL